MTDVEVYARAHTVELLVNGKRAGRKRLRNTCRVLFKTAYHDGEITAVSYDAAGREIGRDTLKTAGSATELRLEPETAACRPGEMVYFRIRYTDADGEGKPMEKHVVSVTAENGRVMGTANGASYFKGNYAQAQTPTYFGEAQTIVQALAAGVLRLKVSDGERTATVELPCREEQTNQT